MSKSAELRRLYADEYASMLRVVKDRELAKEAARVNVSALAAGQRRIVSREERWPTEKLRDALRGGEDLAVVRRGYEVSVQRLAAGVEREQPVRGLER